MSNSHRGPSIDVSYHVSVHLAKLLQSRRFLEIDQSETIIACGGHVIYGRFSIRFANFVPIINKHGHHRQLLFLIGQFLKIFYSEAAWPNGLKHGRKHL
jgi:hypothetical protein